MIPRCAFFLIALGANIVGAQGEVNFANWVLTPSQPVTFRDTGERVSGTNYIAVLLYGREDNSLIAHPSFARFRSPVFVPPPGFWAGGVRTLSGFTFAEGETARLQVAVFDANHFGSYEAAVAGQGILGRSAIFDFVIPTPPLSPASLDMVNFAGFTIVPEPSAIAFAALASLLVFWTVKRRRRA
jgi:hypothetical protein